MPKGVKLVLLFCALVLGANDLSEYERALYLESIGEKDAAMAIYKALALKQIGLKNKSQAAIIDNQKIDKSLAPASILANQGSANTSQKASASKDDVSLSEVFDGSGISLHEQNYLLLGSHTFNTPNDGRRSFETKFNLSFKKPLKLPFLGDDKELFLAYSQTSWWQTAKSSVPFRETNYRPEIFMRFKSDDEYLKAVNLGFLHESNGLGGETSRSWNRAYLSADFRFGDFTITPRVWQHLGDLSDNADISRYLGYGDLRVRYDASGYALELLLRNNLRASGNKGAVQAGLIFPIYSGFYGYLQYFNGYGESLIDYNRSISRLGFGIMILR
ncbi:phospholipase A [Campylobacter sp. 19-13652]|uniref:phospholipase A n=1 Tax=Campylobacter sp. 19-13652 TaxID=2840180 RepID=UPI001C79427B|nr:phospholipase A [Campylobacter sp. 19-13652]BCX79972.1 phospholipase [Campylobacter sp. 19-13652]